MASKKSPKGPERRLVPETWKAVQSVVTSPDGRVFAAQNYGPGVCAWTPSGELAWSVALPISGAYIEMWIQLVGEDLYACDPGSAVFRLDAATGEVEATLSMPQYTRSVGVSPDGTTLGVRLSTESALYSLPGVTELARFTEYANESSVAFSPDGRFMAINGHEIHIYDVAKRMHRTTIEPEDSPYSMIFAPSGVLVAGDGSSRLYVYDVDGQELAKIDVLPEKKSKKEINAVAASERHIAAARKDGVVRVYQLGRDFELVATFDKLDNKINNGGYQGVRGLAFSADGAKLFVTAAPKKQPPGVTVFDIP